MAHTPTTDVDRHDLDAQRRLLRNLCTTPGVGGPRLLALFDQADGPCLVSITHVVMRRWTSGRVALDRRHRLLSSCRRWAAARAWRSSSAYVRASGSPRPEQTSPANSLRCRRALDPVVQADQLIGPTTIEPRRPGLAPPDLAHRPCAALLASPPRSAAPTNWFAAGSSPAAMLSQTAQTRARRRAAGSEAAPAREPTQRVGAALARLTSQERL